METSVLASQPVSSMLLIGAREMVPHSKGFEKMKGGKSVDIHNSTFSVLALSLLHGGSGCYLCVMRIK